MRVLNVVSVLSAREGGGNAERTAQLSRAIAAAGVECTVLTLDVGTPEARRPHIGGARLVILPCIYQRFHVPMPTWRQLLALVRGADVIHLMGYWSLLGMLIGYIARNEGVPYVLSPAGALPLFGRSRLIKRLFNGVMGHRLVRGASGWIAVTASELPDFKAYGVDPAAVAVIPNGVVEADYELPERMLKFNAESTKQRLQLLFMGRLNPIKGPDLLLDAFLQIAEAHPQVDLVFAGPDEGLQANLQKRAMSAGLCDRVHFLGFVEGRDKVALYHASTMLIVPSRFEAMSIVAVEAGVCGVPVLMTDQCGLPDLGEVEPGLIVSATVEALAEGLRDALADPLRLRTWGRQWQALVKQRFLWCDIGQRFASYLAALPARRQKQCASS